MKASEIRQRPETELKEILGKKREKLRRFCFDLTSGKVKNVREIRMLKKDIARILTILNE